LDEYAGYLYLSHRLTFARKIGLPCSTLSVGESLYKATRFIKPGDGIWIRVTKETGRLASYGAQSDLQRIGKEICRCESAARGRREEIASIKNQIEQSQRHYVVEEARDLVKFSHGLDLFLADYQKALAKDEAELAEFKKQRDLVVPPVVQSKCWEVKLDADVLVCL